MPTSIYLAKLIGPILAVMGLSLLADTRGTRAMALEFLGSRALIYLAGLLAFVPGLAIVIGHNVWAADWRIIVTLLGWLALIGGLIRIFFPRQLKAFATPVLARATVLSVAGVVMMLLGLTLSYFGYLR